VAEITCHLLPFEAVDGPYNMADDEVLLRAALGGRASLRFYGWSAPTLSLGYFQPFALRRENPRLSDLPCVRRPSGGAALVHHYELTYCLALPAGPPWQPGGSWLTRLHRIVVGALRGLGVEARLHEGAEVEKGPVLCFLDHTPGDVLLGGSKIAGSAQRRRHGALLQHGAVLLRQSPYTPELPGIAELAGLALPDAVLADAIRTALSRETGWTLSDRRWTGEERRAVEELALEKYANRRWTEKR
jgi:lipoate-protein ligase A